jgi:sugar phosphate isomerase/epimerase
VKLCLDVPLFYDRQSSDYIHEAVKKCKDHLLYTHYGAWNFSEVKGEVVQEPAPSFGGKINYEAFIEGLRQIHYDGYLVSEYCLPVLKNHTIAGIEEVDEATSMALRYMKKLVNKTPSHSRKETTQTTLV